MVFNQREEVCPVCGVSARITRKWVVNRYGKRYDYFIYHHQGFIHYSNQDPQSSKSFKKGELEKVLIETINSQDFKLGSFRIKDLKNLLSKEFPNLGFGSIKVSLNRLAEVGIIEKQRRGRSLFFVNTVSKERLSFIIDSIVIELEDADNDSMFRKHMFIYKVKNDHSWPLYYIPFRVVGDVETTFEDLHLRAYDPSDSKDIKVMLVEDALTDKRVLLKLSSPLFPGERRDIRIEYRWSEPKQIYVFSAATNMSNFQFSVSGNIPTKLNASLTSASRNVTTDLTDDVTERFSSKWKYINSITLKDVEAFSVLQLKWRLPS